MSDDEKSGGQAAAPIEMIDQHQTQVEEATGDTPVAETNEMNVSAPPDERDPKAPAVAPPMESDDEADAGYKFDLPAFHGPLDLLLHLIKHHKVDIYDIPIAMITEQFNSYLEAMEQLDLEVAADYIYMAALLIHIKSKMLLPRDESATDDIEDPRKELVDRLLEYQRFKSVAESFAELDVLRMGIWPRPVVPRPDVDESEIDMSEVSLFDLIDAFRNALNRFKLSHPHAIELRRTVHKVGDKMAELYQKAKERPEIGLQWFLEGRDRDELIAIFLGMLELVRLGAVSLRQGENFADIVISKTDKEIDQAQFAMFDNA